MKTRATDEGTVAPEALARQKKKRVRLTWGSVFAALCVLSFLWALMNGDRAVLVGSFLGGMVAANVIPFTEIPKYLPWRRDG